MNNDQSKHRVAQPADEEIKKHGDLLDKQVKDAAGKQSPNKDDNDGEQDEIAPRN
jgi:hypothetical protein